MNNILSIWKNSPLRREPRLLARSMVRKLGWRASITPTPAPAGLIYTIPPEWESALRGWFDDCRVSRVPPAEEIFGCVFPRHQLIAGCRGEQPVSSKLEADIKLVWDFGRSHHAPLAACIRGPGCAEALAGEVRELMALPTEGPLWSCPMDIALRAVNWLVADALLAGALGRSVGPSWSGLLWQHLDTVWRRIEAYRVSSNHYLSNLLGLALLGSVFPGDRLAAKARAFTRREWPRALLAQTYQDGGAYEGSIPYHAFVTEMALLAQLLDPTPWTVHARQRLHAMVDVVRAHRTASGGLPLIGDDDSGRVLAVDHGSDIGRADALLALANRAGFSDQGNHTALFPDSGWWVYRGMNWFVHAEFGGVGFHGIGAHAHDDDFALWIEHRGVPLFIDPGSYLYTPDRAARDEFRSAYRHTTIRLLARGEQPEKLETAGAFEWRGRVDPLTAIMEPPAVCTLTDGIITRRIAIAESSVSVTDHIKGDGEAWWFFHVHPDVRHYAAGGGLGLEKDGMRWCLNSMPLVELQPVAGGFAPRYGTRLPSVVYRGHADVRGELTVTWRLEILC